MLKQEQIVPIQAKALLTAEKHGHDMTPFMPWAGQFLRSRCKRCNYYVIISLSRNPLIPEAPLAVGFALRFDCPLAT